MAPKPVSFVFAIGMALRARKVFLIATVEAAIARGCRHYSESGELLATTLAVVECLQREGFVTVEKPSH
jgi:hypothetical protein